MIGLQRSAKRWICCVLATLCAHASVAHSAASVTYIHTDLAGSPIAATDANGAVVWRETYRPYGEQVKKQSASTTNRQFFHDKPYDPESGLSYFGARYYDPLVGRFMGTDPELFEESNLHSFNRYAYGNNNPYRYRDPDGSSPLDLIFLAVDVGRLGYAVYTGEGVGSALIDVGMSTLGVLSPIPAAGQALKAVRTAERVAEGARAIAAKEGALVIGRGKDLAKADALRAGEYKLGWKSKLPNWKAEWKENAGRLRDAMSQGKPIRDASPGDTESGFLRAERNLLRDRGWTHDAKTNYWNPPTP